LRLASGRVLNQPAQLPHIAGLGKRLLVQPRLKRVLERDHQLDTLE
jgi:hypothetical protein